MTKQWKGEWSSNILLVCNYNPLFSNSFSYTFFFCPLNKNKMCYIIAYENESSVPFEYYREIVISLIILMKMFALRILAEAFYFAIHLRNKIARRIIKNIFKMHWWHQKHHLFQNGNFWLNLHQKSINKHAIKIQK